MRILRNLIEPYRKEPISGRRPDGGALCAAPSEPHSGFTPGGAGAEPPKKAYPTSAVSQLIACPFCHELFARGEAKECPACGLALTDLAKVSLSHDALAEDDFGIPIQPHLEPLSVFEVRRGRGILLVVAILASWLFSLRG